MADVLVWGVDFTSAPRANKPIVVVGAGVEGGEITPLEHLTFSNLDTFSDWLNTHPRGIIAVDAPFGQPRKLLEHWHITKGSQSWTEYVSRIASLSKRDFADELNRYRATRPKGDKHHLRRCDQLAGACSPMMLYGVPVAKMFFVLAPMLLAANINLPPLRQTTSPCTCVEGYPALVVKALWDGKAPPYKSDTRSKQTADKKEARATLMRQLQTDLVTEIYGLQVHPSHLDEAFVTDPMGDALDALLACVQAAWASRQDDVGIPAEADALEGWIVDPALR